MFYQAQGLERLVSGSKNMVYIEIFSLLSVIVACYFITRALMHSMLHAITKEMMLMHMHGMSRKTISTQFFAFVIGIVKPKLVAALVCSAIIFLWLSATLFRDEMGVLQFLITALIVLLVFGLNAIGLKKSIHKKVCESTSNENISRMLRN